MRGRAWMFLALGGLAALAAVALWARAGPQRSKAPTAASRLETAIAEIEAGRRTTPLIGEPTAGGEVEVTFLARSAGGRPPRIVSDATGWGEQPGDRFSFEVGAMTPVERSDRRGRLSDWCVLVARVAPRARVEYLVSYAPGDYRTDPHNPRRAPVRGGGPASEFVTPGYVPPAEVTDSPVAVAGRVIEASVESRALSGAVSVIVYTPPGYGGGGHYPVAVFHDRLQWGREGAGPRLLDWLIAHAAIEPVVAVFAGSGRAGDDEVSVAVRTFLASELPGWLASRYRVTRNASERAILGVSYGAKDALAAAVGRTAAYGRVGLLIPGRRLQPADIHTLAAQPAGGLEVAILAGLYDAPNLATARSVRDEFTAAGHTVHYLEVPEGHNAATWRHHAGGILTALFPPRCRG